VTGLLNSEDSLDPGDNLMRARVRRLIQVDASVLQIILQRSLQGSRACRDGGVVVSENVHFMVVFEEEGPFGAVKGGILVGGFDGERLLGVNLFFDLFLNDLSTFLLVLSHGLLNFYYLWNVIIFILMFISLLLLMLCLFIFLTLIFDSLLI
jgi:hypothetical protein